LTQVQGVLVEQRSVAEQKKSSLQGKWNDEKAQLQQGNEQLLVEQLEVKEAIKRALFFVIVIEVQTEERVPQQVAQLEDMILKLQQHIADLELHVVPETPHKIRDKREITSHNVVDRLKDLALECK
jgi:hypothetical protein